MVAPYVSVILPVYNQAPYLDETIASVLAQSYTDFELLILDDGSTDGSTALIRQWAERDARIQAFYGPNAGRCAATNALVARAQGQWCALLDADDVMLPERLARQVAFHAQQPELDASSCHCYYINGKGQPLGAQRYPFLQSVAQSREATATGQLIQCAMTGLFIARTVYEASGGLSARFWPCDDFEFFNRLLQQGYVLVIQQEVLMNYRIHPGAATSRNPLHMFDVMDYATRCLAQRRAKNPEPEFAEFMADRQQEDWLTKLNRKRFFYSQLFYREAHFTFSAKKYLTFSKQFTASFLLSPGYVFQNVINLIKKNRRTTSASV